MQQEKVHSSTVSTFFSPGPSYLFPRGFLPYVCSAEREWKICRTSLQNLSSRSFQVDSQNNFRRDVQFNFQELIVLIQIKLNWSYDFIWVWSHDFIQISSQDFVFKIVPFRCSRHILRTISPSNFGPKSKRTLNATLEPKRRSKISDWVF